MSAVHDTKGTTPYGDMPMLIGGELVASEDGRWIESIDPATESVLGRVPRSSAGDIGRAVEAARGAQPAWAALPVARRAEYLHRIADGLARRAERILEVEVMDTGNSIAAMRNDVANSIEKLKFFAGLGYEAKGITIPSTAGNLHYTVREPYGVVGRIFAFNHPLSMAVGGIAAPLMAGNTVVEKPSEQSPLTAMILGEICREALPPGVVNIVSGSGDEAGDALVRHPHVKRISFVGSRRTGMRIQKAAAETTVKHVSLELGGKNPMIVFPDADYERAVQSAVGGMNFAWQSQSCASTSRLFVHESIHDRFLADVVSAVRKIRVGLPLDPATQMGPINSKAQYDKVLHYIAAGTEDGARLVTGGRRPQGEIFGRGYWIEPTVFADVRPDMRIARDEIFGPVLSVFRWRDVDEVIETANALDYGLTASIWTRDLNTALRTAARVESGYIWVNASSARYRGVPYGGYKGSGVGRDSGSDEILTFTEEKAVNVILSA